MKFIFSEVLRNLSLTKGQSLLNVIAIVLAVYIITAAAAINYVSFYGEKKIKEEFEVNVFLESDISSSQKEKIENAIKEYDDVKSYSFINNDEARDKFIAETGEDFTKVLDINPLPSSYTVIFTADGLSTESINNFVIVMQRFQEVNEIIYDSDLLFYTLNFFNKAKLPLLIISLLLIVFTVYSLLYTNSNIYRKRFREYSIMLTVGAKKSAITSPLILTNLLLSAIAAFFVFIINNWLINAADNYFTLDKFINSIKIINIASLALALFFGAAGAFITLLNYNKLIKNRIITYY